MAGMAFTAQILLFVTGVPAQQISRRH